MARRRSPARRARQRRWARALLALPAAFLLALLVGGIVTLNRDWREDREGIPVYLSDNGVHVDIVMPVRAAGLDWSRVVPRADMAAVPPGFDWVAIGSGAKGVYLDTPSWADLTLRNAAKALVGDARVMHVQYAPGPGPDARLLLLSPRDYRRLWAAVRASFALDARGRPVRLAHEGYGPTDAFYSGRGRFDALRTCNQWVASRLRIAGIAAPLWTPFTAPLMHRYRDPAAPM